MLCFSTFPSPRFSTPHSFTDQQTYFLLYVKRRRLQPISWSWGRCDWLSAARRAGQAVLGACACCSRERAAGAIRGLASAFYERKRNKHVLFGSFPHATGRHSWIKSNGGRGVVKWFALLKSHVLLVLLYKGCWFCKCRRLVMGRPQMFDQCSCACFIAWVRR